MKINGNMQQDTLRVDQISLCWVQRQFERTIWRKMIHKGWDLDLTMIHKGGMWIFGEKCEILMEFRDGHGGYAFEALVRSRPRTQPV